jgi:hypothetical protein
MYQLKPFKEDNSDFKLLGDLFFKDSLLQLNFELTDPKNIILNSFDKFKSNQKYSRAHELWKDTCFEAFWSESGSSKYWELNFSTQGKWNLYFFENYRQPSPPKESRDFEFVKALMINNNLEIKLKPNIKINNLEFSLCAILKIKSGDTLYYSTAHLGQKPDFHIRESLKQFKSSKEGK